MRRHYTLCYYEPDPLAAIRPFRANSRSYKEGDGSNVIHSRALLANPAAHISGDKGAKTRI